MMLQFPFNSVHCFCKASVLVSSILKNGRKKVFCLPKSYRKLSSAFYTNTTTSEASTLSTNKNTTHKYKFDLETEVSASLALDHSNTNALYNDTVRSTYQAIVTDSWSIGDAPNGGYLMSIAISAARMSIPFRDPLFVNACFFNKAIENTVLLIDVTVLNLGKTTATVEVSFRQAGILRCQFIGTYGTLSSMKGLTRIDISAPILPPVEDCIDASASLLKSLGSEKLRIANEISMHMPRTDSFARHALKSQIGEEAALNAWVCFADGRMPCLRSLSFFCDALPPPVINLSPTGWVPTMEYTVHFWSRPSPTGGKWLRSRFSSSVICNGTLHTVGELWSEDGQTLLATSRQMARLLTPR